MIARCSTNSKPWNITEVVPEYVIPYTLSIYSVHKINSAWKRNKSKERRRKNLSISCVVLRLKANEKP